VCVVSCSVVVWCIVCGVVVSGIVCGVCGVAPSCRLRASLAVSSGFPKGYCWPVCGDVSVVV
jgi:sugar phosphate permease